VNGLQKTKYWIKGWYSCVAWVIPVLIKSLFLFIKNMSCNLTRFYYDIDGWPVTEDIETTEADEYEEKLEDQDIEYTRIDL
jgi:hypothetical protein